MCKKKQFKYCPSEIDECMKKVVDFINVFGKKRTLASCCGHKKYPMTIVVDIGLSKRVPFEIFSGEYLPRQRKFYKKDKQGYYYIPETLKTDSKSEVGE